MDKISSENINQNTLFQSFAPVASRWLAWQCKMISEVKIGTVFIKKNRSSDDLEMLASWSEKPFESMTDTLHELAHNVLDDQSNIPSKVTCHLNAENTICDVTTLPLHYNNEVIGAVIFLQSVRSEEQKRAVFQLFQWGCAWLESTLEATHGEENQADPLVFSLLQLALQDVPVEVSGHQICNLLAQKLECTRTALGLMQGLQVNTLALSDQLRFDKRASHIREMETAMEEAVDQKQAVLYPKSDAVPSSVTHKHNALSAAHEDACILTVPFSDETDTIGAMLLLRPKNRPFTEQEVNLLQHTAQLLGPALALKLRDEHSFTRMFAQSFKKKIKPIFGAGHLMLKMSILGFAVVLTTLALVKTDYYTYAKSSLEGAIQQVIVAPQNGFIESAKVRAGDKVETGQVMVSLNDLDMKLEYEKLLSERDKTNKEYREALALRERAKVSILSAQIAQVDAQLGLIKGRLKRSQLKAPFSGIVVSGDLSQSLGAPVEKGEQLFEVAPLGNYRVALNVDDHDVSKLKIGQRGSLRLVGLPYDQLPITVSRITPVAAAKDGGNYFRVEATLNDKNNTRLQPGMQGIAKVQVGEESILWVWTHTVIERLRLWLWSIGL